MPANRKMSVRLQTSHHQSADRKKSSSLLSSKRIRLNHHSFFVQWKKPGRDPNLRCGRLARQKSAITAARIREQKKCQIRKPKKTNRQGSLLFPPALNTFRHYRD